MNNLRPSISDSVRSASMPDRRQQSMMNNLHYRPRKIKKPPRLYNCLLFRRVVVAWLCYILCRHIGHALLTPERQNDDSHCQNRTRHVDKLLLRGNIFNGNWWLASFLWHCVDDLKPFSLEFNRNPPTQNRIKPILRIPLGLLSKSISITFAESQFDAHGKSESNCLECVSQK